VFLATWTRSCWSCTKNDGCTESSWVPAHNNSRNKSIHLLHSRKKPVAIAPLSLHHGISSVQFHNGSPCFASSAPTQIYVQGRWHLDMLFCSFLLYSCVLS
jgi:hypothetical protein